MITALFAIAFMLPLSAADVPHVPYTGACGNVIGELIVKHAILPLIDLRMLCTVSKHMNTETSKILEPCHAQLKTFVKQKYHADHCEITYSPDRLSAAIVEKTGLESTNNETIDHFIYIYIDDALGMKEVFIPYQQDERKANYPPFFTPKYVCLDFGISNPNPPLSEITGLCWNRYTITVNEARFYITIGNNQIRTAWFIEKLPNLYAQIMQTPNFFECDFGNSPSTFHKKILEQHGFSFDLAKANILTPKDVKILSNFVPGGKDAQWCEVNQEKNRYLLFNLVACYGNDTDMLGLVDQHVEKQMIKSPGCNDFFVVSTCRDIVVVNNQHKYPDDRWTITDRDDPHFSAVGQATLNYVQQLKKESVFIEKNWKSNEPMPLKKRMRKVQQALSFLKKERMTFIKQNNQLIRYDLLNRYTVAVFTDNTLRTSGTLKKQLHAIPKNIDPKSLKVADNGQIEYKTIDKKSDS
jgi:hypothetical protein